MDYKNIKLAGHHLVFMLALIMGSILIYYLNGIDMKKEVVYMKCLEDKIAPDVLSEKKELNQEEIEWAKVAWQYFEVNYNKKTGLVNSVNNFQSTTIWDSGNYLVALISAYRLKIIDFDEFDTKLSKILHTLATLKLYKNFLPNKVYNTQTLKMSKYDNSIAKNGIGWSAIDIGRILIPLYFIKQHYPKYSEMVEDINSRWVLQKSVRDRELYGATLEKGKEKILQEGRLGYEQYSAKGFELFGIDVIDALRYDRYLKFANIYDIQIPYDRRDKKNFGANNYVLMESYMLDGLEFGWDEFSKEFSYRLYKVQENRYLATDKLTAFSEDHIDQKPYFLYNSIFVNQKEWVAIDDSGKIHKDKILLSTKTAFALHSLYNSDYSKKLIKKIQPLQSDKGWYAGIYEKDGRINKALTCNTNAIILLSILYKKEGALLNIK